MEDIQPFVPVVVVFVCVYHRDSQGQQQTSWTLKGKMCINDHHMTITSHDYGHRIGQPNSVVRGDMPLQAHYLADLVYLPQ